MDLKNNYWTKNSETVDGFFDKKEIALIASRIKSIKKIECAVFCSFESRFAKSGGLAAVTTKILPYLKEVNNISNVILLTPFYPNIISANKLKPTGLSIKVPFDNKLHGAEILKYVQDYEHPADGIIAEFYLKADGFFESKNKLNDPYIYNENNREKSDAALRENSLFFCQAAPFVLQKLGFNKNTLFHLQDWETILIALTAKTAMLDGILESCASVCTLHNPFDSGWLKLDSLAKILDSKRSKKIFENFQDNLTAHKIGLSLVDGALTTVSKNFAKELKQDILHRGHFAPHLQNIFEKSRIKGVNNGMFVDFPPEFTEFAKPGQSPKISKANINRVRKTKLEKRVELLKILDDYHPPQRFGKLTYRNGPLTHLPEDVPIILMSGRLDPNQKGFDIFLRAIDKFREDEIKVVLSPLPVRESDLVIFRKVAESSQGNVTVFPIRMAKGFHELQIGSTFGLMPSVYEPFGAAIEYMVNGTLVIARKTGGLVDQIDHRINGFLFKEPRRNYNLQNIKSFMEASGRVELRQTNPWCQDMVDSLYKILKRAIKLYQKENEKYYEMILNGFMKAQNFDWKTSAKEYYSLFGL
ncbi:glycogen/starch synthase [candidate division KSB1 bacterium]|nr:glycogen/starch synthase [candidate division KSB1 bacterium]